MKTRTRVAVTVLPVRTAERECLALTSDRGATLLYTPDHPIYAADRGRSVQQAREVVGMSEEIVVPSLVVSHERYGGMRRVFDLTVSGDHHNFIASGIVVHNKSYGECDDETSAGESDDQGQTGTDSSGVDTTGTGDSTNESTEGADASSSESSDDATTIGNESTSGSDDARSSGSSDGTTESGTDAG